MAFKTRQINNLPDVTAPDGSEVRLLCQMSRGSMAHFALPPGAVSIAVAHQTIEELWYFISGEGRMWRSLDGVEEVVDVKAGSSLAIPPGTKFQFRCDSAEPLCVIGVAMPPWPGPAEAHRVEGIWESNL